MVTLNLAGNPEGLPMRLWFYLRLPVGPYSLLCCAVMGNCGLSASGMDLLERQASLFDSKSFSVVTHSRHAVKIG